MRREFQKLIRVTLILCILLSFTKTLKASDSLRYSISLNYYWDLSDTYDGGGLFSSELKIKKSWFGASISYGHFQSYSVFKYIVYVDEIDKSLVIPFDDVSI